MEIWEKDQKENSHEKGSQSLILLRTHIHSGVARGGGGGLRGLEHPHSQKKEEKKEDIPT